MWGRIAAMVTTFLKKLAALFGVNFAAQKVLTTTLFLTVLPIILWNVIHKFFEWQLGYISNHLDSANIQTSIIQLTGLAGYIGYHMKIPEVISVYLSALTLIFTLRVLRI